MKSKKDKFGISLGALMIIGTLLPYLTFWGESDNLMGIGTKYGTIVIVGGVITILSGLLRIGVGYIVGGIVSLIGIHSVRTYYGALLKLFSKGIGYYVILLSSIIAIIYGVALVRRLIKK